MCSFLQTHISYALWKETTAAHVTWLIQSMAITLTSCRNVQGSTSNQSPFGLEGTVTAKYEIGKKKQMAWKTKQSQRRHWLRNFCTVKKSHSLWKGFSVNTSIQGLISKPSHQWFAVTVVAPHGKDHKVLHFLSFFKLFIRLKTFNDHHSVGYSTLKHTINKPVIPFVIHLRSVAVSSSFLHVQDSSHWCTVQTEGGECTALESSSVQN